MIIPQSLCESLSLGGDCMVLRSITMENEDQTYRREFLARTLKTGLGVAFGLTTMGAHGESQGGAVQPHSVTFKDDGTIPNSRYPVLLYHNVTEIKGSDPASQVQQLFAVNNWTNSWRNGIYTYHHYHSTSHEVLGVYRGSVTVRLGGEQGQNFTVQAG